MRNRTLLIVDDDIAWLKISAALFTRLNYKVVTAATCAEGIRLAELYKPACILLDFGLPDANGCALAYNIKEDLELKKTPIIMVSGEEEEEFRSNYEYKLDGFFLKGWPPARLLSMVHALLRRVNLDLSTFDHKDLYLDGTSLEVFRDSKWVAQLSQEQFNLLSLLIEKTPNFVQEEDVAMYIFGEVGEIGKIDAIKMLAYRLRQKLGRQLARRIKSVRKRGWIYLNPRAHPTTVSA